MRSRLITLALSCTLSFASAALADDANDLIILSNGGRVRGTVLEQSAELGVRVKLYDGRVRSFANAEVQRVQYADGTASQSTPAPAVSSGGAIRVHTSEPATFTVDDMDESAAPGSVDHLEAGRHSVRVAFAAGGSLTRAFRVRDGEVTEADLSPTAPIKIGRAHAGVHFDLGAAGGFRYQHQSFLPGGELRLGVTYGVARALDLVGSFNVGYYTGSLNDARYSALFGDRLGWCVYYPHPNCSLQDATQTSIPIRARFDLELHLGTVYSMSLGVDSGVSVELQGATAVTTETAPIAPNVNVVPLFGVHGSLLTFRFGSHRQAGISLTQGALFGADKPVFEQTLGLHYSFL